MNEQKQTSVNFYHIQEPASGRTPAEAFEQLSGQQKAMLESTYQHEGKGMHSFLCTDPIQEITSTKQETIVKHMETGKTKTFDGDALSYIKENVQPIKLPISVPFYGGLIGYVGYDAIRSYVHVGERKELPFQMPDIHFFLYNNVVVFDHKEQVIHYIAITYTNESPEVLEERVFRMKQSIQQIEPRPEGSCTPLQFNEIECKEQFIQQVHNAKKQIDQGMIEQIVLSKRFRASGVTDSFSYYKKLRQTNPSPYMFYIECNDFTLFGASPESVVQTKGKKMFTNPIAGTRPRGKNEEDDDRLQKELLNDQKELAEHDMLVELSKREMQALCETDSITVPVYQAIEMYEYVMHIVSKVQGTLKKDYSSIDALIHCLPAGTVSGTPKVDAMRLINQSETTSRGGYGGTVGYINSAFDMNMVLAIRFMTVIGTDAYIQAGAGIVAASDPEKEYEEILHKARSLMNI